MKSVESGPRYSKPFYYDYGTKGYVDQEFTPTKLPNTNLLHGGRIGFKIPPQESNEMEEDFQVSAKAEKYKGTKFQEDLTFATFQSFKSEWNAHVLSNNLSPQQQRLQLLSKALAGKAKIIISNHFGIQLSETSAEEILNCLEEKIGGHLGVLGKMAMIEKVRQNVKEESLIIFFLNLDTTFLSMPNKSAESKIEAALNAIQSPTLKSALGKKEAKWKGDWIKFQYIANKIWGNMGGKDAESEDLAKMKHQINFIQNQSEQRDRVLMERIECQQ